VLSAQDAAALIRGRVFKRIVRAAAALNDLYDDVALGRAVKVSRGAIGAWWRGAQPEPETLLNLTKATGLSADELYMFVYADGPPPSLPEPGSPVLSTFEEGQRLDRERPQPEAPAARETLPRQPSRGSGAKRG